MDEFAGNPPDPPLAKGGQRGFLELVTNLRITSFLNIVTPYFLKFISASSACSAVNHFFYRFLRTDLDTNPAGVTESLIDAGHSGFRVRIDGRAFEILEADLAADAIARNFHAFPLLLLARPRFIMQGCRATMTETPPVFRPTSLVRPFDGPGHLFQVIGIDNRKMLYPAGFDQVLDRYNLPPPSVRQDLQSRGSAGFRSWLWWSCPESSG